MTGEQEKFRVDFIGIGAEKSATSWIFECLKEHPGICVASRKEVRFFEKPYNYRKGLDYYHSFFRSCGEGKIIGEFSPGYLYHEGSAERIYKDFPRVKLIACLREPVERAFSQYQADVRLKGPLSVYKSFEKALCEYELLVKRGLYYTQLKRYFDLFPKENILVLIYDDLKKDPLAFIQSVYRFLGVDEGFVPSLVDKRKGPTGSVERRTKIPLLNFLLQKAAYLARNNDGLYNLLDRTGIRGVRLRILRANQEKIFKKGFVPVSAEEISFQAKEKLCSVYGPEIDKLEKLLNRDLEAWKNG